MSVETETNCNGFFDSCSEAFQNIPFNMFWKRLIGKSGNCPAVRVTGTLTTTPGTGTQRTPSRTLVNTPGAGSVAAGAQSVTIETSEDFDGTILGETAVGNRAYTFAALSAGDTVGAIAYNIVGGSITINKLV